MTINPLLELSEPSLYLSLLVLFITACKNIISIAYTWLTPFFLHLLSDISPSLTVYLNYIMFKIVHKHHAVIIYK
jgi:hypothetical protein